MDLTKKIETINSKEDLADFVSAMRADLDSSPDKWENPTLGRFLEAMEDWIRAMDMYYKNTGQSLPQNPTWKIFGDILYAARIYE